MESKNKLETYNYKIELDYRDDMFRFNEGSNIKLSPGDYRCETLDCVLVRLMNLISYSHFSDKSYYQLDITYNAQVKIRKSESEIDCDFLISIVDLKNNSTDVYRSKKKLEEFSNYLIECIDDFEGINISEWI